MNEGDDLDLSAVTDPAVRQLRTNHRALRIEHEALVGEHRATMAENAALRAELARLKGGQGQPRSLPGKTHSGDRLPRGKRRREAERDAMLRAERPEARPVEETLPPDAT